MATGYEYGITSLPSSKSTATNKWEMGYKFRANEDMIISGLRVYMPATQTVTANLWGDSSSPLAKVTIQVTSANTWVEGHFDSPVTLLSGKEYIVSCFNNSTRYYGSGSAAIFNLKITYLIGVYGSTANAKPSGTESNRLYPFIDIIIRSAQYKTSGNAVYTISGISSITNVESSRITWQENTPDNTSVSVFAKIDDGEYRQCSSGGAIPLLRAGTDLSDSIIYIKVEMATSDVYASPSLTNLKIVLKNSGDGKIYIFNLNAPNIRSAIGNGIITYDGVGALAGEGGPVEAFSEEIELSGMTWAGHQHDIEHINYNMIANVSLLKIYYHDTREDEHIEYSMSGNAVLTYIGNL